MNRNFLVASCLAIGLIAGCSTLDVGSTQHNISQQAMPAEYGWAGAEGPLLGGSQASEQHFYTVTNRKEFVAALAESGDSPSIIQIRGTINLSSDDSGRELTEKDYRVAPYRFEQYKAAYAPSIWNIKL